MISYCFLKYIITQIAWQENSGKFLPMDKYNATIMQCIFGTKMTRIALSPLKSGCDWVTAKANATIQKVQALINAAI
jgi:hypothetical protein